MAVLYNGGKNQKNYVCDADTVAHQKGTLLQKRKRHKIIAIIAVVLFAAVTVTIAVFGFYCANKTNPQELKEQMLAKAQSYCDECHPSKQALFRELAAQCEDEEELRAAEYAAENVNADWKANALVKAVYYRDEAYMEIANIYDRLVSPGGDGFTEQEARYAIDKLEKTQ